MLKLYLGIQNELLRYFNTKKLISTPQEDAKQAQQQVNQVKRRAEQLWLLNIEPEV